MVVEVVGILKQIFVGKWDWRSLLIKTINGQSSVYSGFMRYMHIRIKDALNILV